MTRLVNMIIIFALVLTGFIFNARTANAITIKQEEKLAREFLQVVLKRYEIVEDPVVNQYLQQVAERIMAVVPPQPFSYHFYIINKEEYNAFALPAGHIFIYSGLMAAMENEEELAGILAHEIAHVTSRHISEKIDRSKKMQIASLAGVFAGILLGAGGSTAAAEAVTAGSLAGVQTAVLAFSREDEMQADQAGLQYLSKAGYGSQGLLTVLKKLRSRQWFGSDQVPIYLRTHPAVDDRIAYVDARMAQNQAAVKQLKPPEDGFALIAARLWALYGDEEAAVQKFRQAVNDRPEDYLSHYALGLVLARAGNRGEAIVHMKRALAKNALNPALLIDLGRIYFMDGRYEAAERMLAGTLAIGPFNHQGQFFLGRAQMALGRMQDAAQTFNELLAQKPNHNQTLYFLGEAYGKLGRLDQAHYFLGRYYNNKKRFKNAIFHLERALTTMTDPDKRKQIEKMLKSLRKKARRVKSSDHPQSR